MITAEEFVEKYQDQVSRAARKEHQQTHLFDVEDLEQEVWLGLLPYYKRMDANGPGFVYNAALTLARRYAERERTDVMYYRGAFIYTPQMVAGELEVGAWESDPNADWDLRLDLQRAYDTLSEREQHLLHEKYLKGISPTNSSPDRKVIERAIDKMTHWLNGNAGLEHVDLEVAGTWA